MSLHVESSHTIPTVPSTGVAPESAGRRERPRNTGSEARHVARRYKATREVNERAGRAAKEAVLKEHADLVARLARRYARASGSVVDLDDLQSVGAMGLLEAYEAYDPAAGGRFRSYAEFRVRGAILDELRRHDPLSQPLRRKARALERARASAAQRLGREPLEQELAEELDMTVDALRVIERNVQCTDVHYENEDDIRSDLTLWARDRSSTRILVKDALDRLPERQQLVLYLYYFQDLGLREIGQVLDLTEARICQIRKSAVARLREILRQDGLPG